MNRKIISVFTLFAFIVFSISCYTIMTKEIRTEADWQGKNVKILSLVKTTGEHIEFSKDNPGRINGDKIVGTPLIKKEITLDRANVISIKKTRKYLRITTKEKEIYHVDVGGTKIEEDKIIFISSIKSSESLSIPLSEVKWLEIKRIDPGSTLFALVGAGAAVYGLIMLGVVLFVVLPMD